MLHNEKELLEQAVINASDYLGIKPEIIEKDYFVTVFLKELVSVMPEFVFKGGTSLAKCYHITKRFSEDIDLNVQSENKPSESEKKRIKGSIVKTAENLRFTLANAGDIKSRRDFNRYIVDYPSSLSASYLKEQLIIETAIYQKPYPVKKMTADSLIYQFLIQNGYSDFISRYGLEPFEINVQTAERTLIDKIYALADYYLSGRITEHSRHIYDIHKLMGIVTINDDLRKLAVLVADERRANKTCLSVRDGADIRKILNEIIAKNVYREDYESITVPLLFETVTYEEAIESLQKLSETNLFDNN